MLANTITLRGGYGEPEITIPARNNWQARREIGPDGYIADCMLGGNPAHGVPIWVDILLRTDGTWVHWTTTYTGDNHYLHIQQEQRGPITEAQRRTVARWYLGLDPRPYGMALGSTLTAWAFAGFTPKQLSERYGDGRKLYLAGSHSPRADRDESQEREALLEDAVESGQLSGAAPADI